MAGLLVFYAGVSLLITGRYPLGIFDLLMGIHRWWLRVQVYAGLMTDVYPPFRLDQGADEPSTGVWAGPPAGPPTGPPDEAPGDAASTGLL